MEVEPEFFPETFDTNLKQYQVCETGFCINKKEIWSVCYTKKPGENVLKWLAYWHARSTWQNREFKWFTASFNSIFFNTMETQIASLGNRVKELMKKSNCV